MNKIYVGNLPYNITEDELQQFFGSFGTIDDVTIITDRHTGRSKGFGFIAFDSDQAAESATEKNGEELGGRKLKVNIAREKSREDGGSRF